MSQQPRLRTGVDPEDHLLGRADAPILIVEYGDYECPNTAAAWFELKGALGERIALVYRHFPITQVYPRALICAEAAEAAAAQGRFWEMHDALLANQGDLGDEALWAYAAGVGVDLDQFVLELQGHQHQPRIERDCMSGARNVVTSTPTFFVNGERYVGPLAALYDEDRLSAP